MNDPLKAPGGMSQKELIAELVDRHGDNRAYVTALSWPEQIKAVEIARQIRVVEAAQPPALFIGMPGTKDYVFDGHAGAGPSGAERWMNCTASLEASRKFLETLTPNQQREFASANTAARQGTTAHAAAEVEALLVLGRITQAEADQTLLELSILSDTDGEAYDDEMAEYITEYVDLVQQYADTRGMDHIMIEARVSAVVPINNWESTYEINGSADFVAMPTPLEPTLVVGDLKYGDGIDVDVDENPQIRIYALGVLSELADEEGNLPDLDQIVYHIVQPRLGGIKTWQESVDDLLRWRDEVLSAALSMALAGVAGGATFAPGELACQWCPVRGACPALAEQRMDAASELFDIIVEAEFADGPGAFPETRLMTDERLGSLLRQVEGLIKIKDDLKAEAQRRLYRGDTVPGYQLVSYTPPRKWKPDAAQELKFIKVPGLWKEPTLVTPTQGLKIMGQTADEQRMDLTELIEVPDKRPVVAPENDRRKTWTGTPPEQMFPDTEGEES